MEMDWARSQAISPSILGQVLDLIVLALSRSDRRRAAISRSQNGDGIRR
jgi:hypothetical protein